MDQTGNVVITAQYDEAYQFDEGLGRVVKDNRIGFINAKNEVIVPIAFDRASGFKDGIAVIMRYDDPNELHSNVTGWYINKDYQALLKVTGYENLHNFSEGVAVVSKSVLDLGYHLINKKGERVFTQDYLDLGDFSEGLAYFDNEEGEAGFIDKNGNEWIAGKYESTSSFSQGVAPVKRNGKWGFINKQDQVVIPFQFEYALSFSEDVAAVQVNGLWGFIDQTGKYIIQPQFKDVASRHNGLIMVRGEKSNFLYYIDLQGNIIKPKI